MKDDDIVELRRHLAEAKRLIEVADKMAASILQEAAPAKPVEEAPLRGVSDIVATERGASAILDIEVAQMIEETPPRQSWSRVDLARYIGRIRRSVRR